MLQIRKPRKIGFFAMLLALLGIGGCQSLEEADEKVGELTMVAYGVPTVHYTIKGKVTDEKGKALEGIQVSVKSRRHGDNRSWYSDIIFPITSDSKGKWEAEPRAMPTDTLQIVFTDIDGAANGGEFAADSIRVPVKIEKDPKNNDAWYVGDAKVDVPTVKLKKK